MIESDRKDHQIDVYKRLAPWQRLEAACELYWLAKEIVRHREKRAHPHLKDDALERRIRSFF